MKLRLRKHTEFDPATGATPGRVTQQGVSDDRGTDYETAGRMHARAEYDGDRLGASRLTREQAVGEQSGARRWIAGGAKARRGQRTRETLQEKLSATQRVKALPGELAAKAAQRTGLKESLKRLSREKLPEARKREAEATDMLRSARARFEQLPRHRKGYFHSLALLVAIELAVVAFDGGALYGALKHAGFSGAVLVFTMVTVPALIAATNHALGVAAAAIGLKLVEEWKLRAAVAALYAFTGCRDRAGDSFM